MTRTREGASLSERTREVIDRVGTLTPARRALLAWRLDGRGASGERNHDDRALVAYVVAREGHPPEANELRRFMGERLPEHLIPAAFIFVGALPRTPSGKIDRRALPAPGVSRSRDVSTRVRPRTELERTLAGVWQEVLGIDQVGVSDNFFDLGGHSLLMMRVQVRIRELLGVDVSVMDLFRYPTVNALAVFVVGIEGTRTDRQPR